jgi:bacillopeptidase F
MKKEFYAIVISLTLVICSVQYAHAGYIDPELQNVLDGLDPGAEVSIIVTLSDQADLDVIREKDRKKRRVKVVSELRGKADKSQKLLKKFLEGKKSKKVVSFWIFNGLAATVRADTIVTLAARPEVDRVSLDETVTLAEPTASTTSPPEWNLSAIRAPEMWAAGYTGGGITVASMDTGVDVYHPDLAAQWRGGSNSWYDPNDQHSTPYDVNGHGTQTMGVMVGRDMSGTAIGVAPDAQWIAVKIFNDAGSSSLSKIHLGYQWLLDPDGNPNTSDSPDVVNNSWGLPNTVDTCYTEFQPDIQVLKAAQIAVIFAAGNEGPYIYTSISPANYPESLSVGAVDANLTIDYASSRGPSACTSGVFPYLVAPGVNIKVPHLTYGGILTNSYKHVTGTSFAAPHVAGAMALLMSANPEASILEIEQALIQSALPLGISDADNETGYGLVDVTEAFLQLNPGSGGPVCTDSDGDGFFSTAECGQQEVDCNDADALIYPGAPEIKHDSIDQDCNGFDLTIDIIKATYATRRDILKVQATSALSSSAALELNGFGPMKWNKKAQKWVISISGVGYKPGSVTVTGVEGVESVDIQ